MDHLTVQVGLGLPTKKAASVLLKPNKGEGSGHVGSNVNRASGAGTGKKGGWLVFWKNNISNTSRGVETKDQKQNTMHHHHHHHHHQQQQQQQQEKNNIRPKQFILFCF